jgi:acyl-coenzyme A synthetase/AMP-(fatty) acid ligase
MYSDNRVQLKDVKKGDIIWETDMGMVARLKALEDAHSSNRGAEGISCRVIVENFGRSEDEETELFESVDCPSAYRLKLYRDDKSNKNVDFLGKFLDLSKTFV